MNFIRTIFLISLIAISTSTFAQQGGQIYKKYCAGCHGGNLEGNSASALTKKDFKYGRDQAGIFKNIKHGIPNTEMIGWRKFLNDNEINAVTQFILSFQNKKIEKKSVIPATLITQAYVLKVEKLVTEGIKTPWGIEFLDKNRALFTEKAGKIRWLINGKLDPVEITGMPATHTKSSTGGFMDIALDPKYPVNGWVYLGFSQTNGDINDKNSAGMTKIICGRIKGHQWTNEQILFEVPDSLKIVGGDRWGCRLLFDKQGYLFFTIGDMGKAEDSQDLTRATGKVFRIKPDGSIPDDNPFLQVPGALPAIYTIGNRNVQGLSLNPLTGDLWASEHGPRGGDELNILKKGLNYGWPIVTYGVDYSGKVISDRSEKEGIEKPVTQWTPSIAVCPIEFSKSQLFKKWGNNLLVGALGYEELQRLVIKDNKVTETELLFKGFGRVRDIKTAPDGSVYVLLNRPDMIVRITPQSTL